MFTVPEEQFSSKSEDEGTGMEEVVSEVDSEENKETAQEKTTIMRYIMLSNLFVT